MRYTTPRVIIATLLFIFTALGCGNSKPAPDSSACRDLDAYTKDNPQGYISLCWQAAGFYQQQQDFLKALAWTEQVLALQPQDQQAQLYKAQLLFALGRNEECQKMLEKLENDPALKDSPLLVSARGLLYQSYKNTGRLKAEESAVEKKLKAKKIDIDTYRRALMIMRAEGDFDRIIETAQKAAKAFPDESSFRIALGYAYEMKGKAQAALKVYSQASDKFPENLSISSRIVELNMKEGRFKEAEAELTRVQKLYLADPRVLAQIQNYRTAIAAEQQKAGKKGGSK